MIPFSETVREALRSQVAAKQRTVLALIGIVIGIGSVIALVTVGEMVQYTSLLQFKQMGTNILSIGKEFSGDGQQSRLTDKSYISFSDAMRLQASAPQLEAVAPYTVRYVQPLFQDHALDIPVLGVTGEFADMNKLKMAKGRFIADLDNYAFYAVLGANAAEKLKKMGVPDPIGEKIFFQKRGFVIVGVLEYADEGGMRPYGINDGMIIPIHTSFMFMKSPQIHGIIARLTTEADRRQATEAIRRYFRGKENPMPVRVRSAEQLISEMAKQSRLFTLLLGAIASISLVVGGIGVMNVMLVSVTERRKEIGIRRALGALQRDIQLQFLVESVALCLVGGLIGILLGVGVAYVLGTANDWVFFVPASALVLGVGVSSATGVFFGFFPARQAARLNPILALRDE